MTHNFSLFKQIKNWFKYVGDVKRGARNRIPVQFYQTHCAKQPIGRNSTLKELDPLLKNYDSEYHYLFSLVHKGANTLDATLADYYHLPNVARRLLETFLAFRKPGFTSEDGLNKIMDSLEYDEVTKLRILRFVHSHSHEGHLPAAEHDPNNLGEAPAVLAEVLALMREEDPKHADEMEALISAA